MMGREREGRGRVLKTFFREDLEFHEIPNRRREADVS